MLIKKNEFIKNAENLLKESKQVGVLYHFTTIQNAIKILNTNLIKSSKYFTAKIGDNNYRCVSFTRDKNLNLKPLEFESEVRFTVNGDALSNKYQIMPYNDFQQQAYYKDTLDSFNSREKSDEAEEIVVADVINNFLNYVSEIQIGEVDARNNIKNPLLQIKKLVNIANTKGINVTYVNEKINGDMFNNLYESTLIQDDINLHTLKLKDTLNPDIWDKHGKLDPEVKEALDVITKDFYKTLETSVPLEDVIFTGSLANYNWSEESDIDLHLVIDYTKMLDGVESNEHYNTEDLLKEYFSDKCKLWNDSHKMTIYGHPVEIYVQDKNEKLVSSGVYSIKSNTWLRTPSHLKTKPDYKFIRKKANHIISIIDNIAKKEDIAAIDPLKEKLKKFRKRGLDEDGEMSNSNLIYKVLRREGYIDKLYNLKDELFDRETTVG